MAEAETLRETLERLGYLADVLDRVGFYPDSEDDFLETLDWTPEQHAGAHMLRVIEAFHGFARLVYESTHDRVRVDDLVMTLMVIALG